MIQLSGSSLRSQRLLFSSHSPRANVRRRSQNVICIAYGAANSSDFESKRALTGNRKPMKESSLQLSYLPSSHTTVWRFEYPTGPKLTLSYSPAPRGSPSKEVIACHPYSCSNSTIPPLSHAGRSLHTPDQTRREDSIEESYLTWIEGARQPLPASPNQQKTTVHFNLTLTLIWKA